MLDIQAGLGGSMVLDTSRSFGDLPNLFGCGGLLTTLAVGCGGSLTLVVGCGGSLEHTRGEPWNPESSL